MSQKAVELGIKEIEFSEHVDFDPVDRGFGYFNYKRYTSEIREAQESFKGRLVIRKGVEIDYQHCFEDDVEAWLRDKRFDYIIGSVHYLNHELITRRLVESNDLREIYNAYFYEVTKSVKSGLFDVVGHLDVIRKFIANRSLELKNFGYEEDLKAILEDITKKRMYLEINSKFPTLKQDCTEMTPSKGVVEEYIEKGGRLISIGSDAHSTEEIGSGIKEILDFLATYDEYQVRLLFE
jgi:histidinol-phosphatase (PHP family)